MPPETFGELVARMRERADLSQGELAGIVGRSRNAVQAWEKSGAMPEIALFPKLAQAIKLPVAVLLEIAGLEGDFPQDPELSALADDAESLSRRLRALATAPSAPPQPNPTPEDVQRARGRVSAAKKGRRPPASNDQ